MATTLKEMKKDILNYLAVLSLFLGGFVCLSQADRNDPWGIIGGAGMFFWAFAYFIKEHITAELEKWSNKKRSD